MLTWITVYTHKNSVTIEVHNRLEVLRTGDVVDHDGASWVLSVVVFPFAAEISVSRGVSAAAGTQRSRRVTASNSGVFML